MLETNVQLEKSSITLSDSFWKTIMSSLNFLQQMTKLVLHKLNNGAEYQDEESFPILLDDQLDQADKEAIMVTTFCFVFENFRMSNL